ncbi:hypothetical protein LTR02_011634 [Friedmanniomyces endolithicus]|nr:hypothetical protein LTR94_006010 [Friedmanniomyces endolithicus]KAK0789534.1 hypothetical protein LTR59_009604 [Friedmanniomyces endolithicus]KAK0797125.1 hypothetical protein LTR75_009973 [Friedmanniomyces endolithicus]KAK0803640.1 hypothetical protein LTR38_006031 [Friedmanniomyces endolithicus]KAK0848743.1 hypothetical protein LTR03_005531 [Friedmanniomyces endolithicus]
MHAIKKAARREAWYGSDQPDAARTINYNPFSRNINRQRRQQDVENNLNQLSHVRSENDVGPSPIEAKRKEAWASQGGPSKAPTFPSGPAGPLPGREYHDDKIDDVVSHGDTSKDSSEKPSSGSAPTDEANGVDRADGTEGGARNRKGGKFRKFMPWKHSTPETGEDVQRTETSESKGKKFKHKPTFVSMFKAVFYSWINILLVAVPVGIALEYTKVNRVVVFVINFIAIIPLAAMLSYSTEELAMYIGETLGGLLNATFGNAVELIVGIIALNQGKILIVQTSLIGSMLSNLLLVMGMCFFCGGVNRNEQFFNLTVAQTAASLLALAVGALIIPTAFNIFATSVKPGDIQLGVTQASRGTAVMLLFVYVSYLVFQLRTHIDMYNAPSQKAPKKSNGKRDEGEAFSALAAIGVGTGAASAGGQINRENLIHDQSDKEEDEPQLTIIGAVCTLAGTTVLIALCAEFMVSAINSVAQSVSQEFIGLILLPIVGNAAEHATAVTVAIKDKLDLSIGVAVGSSLQIALLVLPLMVCFNWFGLGSPADLTLSFDGFQICVLFIAIIVVNYVIQDGKSHWLEGMLLMVTYLVIALAAWYYPVSGDVAG